MPFPVTVTDALGRAVTLPRPPRRIVSLVPSTTETLFALGLGERVVGVTRFCNRPADGVRGKAIVGGTKKLDLRKIRSLSPDLVLANREENRREEIEPLAAELPVFVQYPCTVREALREVETVGALTGAEEASGRMAREINDARRAAAARTAARPRIRIVYLIWRAPWWVAGRGTYIDDLVTLAGGANAFGARADGARYFPVTAAEITGASPDLLILPDEPYPFSARHVQEVAGFFPGKAVLVDGRLCSWHGAATAEGIRYLAGILAGLPGDPEA